MKWITDGLGLDLEPGNLTFLHVGLRAAIVFIFALILVRMGDRRFLAKLNPLDVILGFILASMLARAVNGSAPFFPTLGGSFVLLLLHKLFSMLCFHSHTFGRLVKGCEDLIIEQGRVHQDNLRKNHVTEKDLLEELRQEGNVSSPEHVKLAFLERSGKISVVPD